MKKLAAKAGLVQVPPMGGSSKAATPVDETRPKTAPGSMLHFMSNQSAAIKEAEDLRDRLKSFDGASPVRQLDPALIKPSKWANRHETAFDTPEFQELKAEILAAGGNVQAIRVRPVGEGFEIVYGHRRHRACLELGIPVLSHVEPATDEELFVAMDRENRARQNLSAWEQGSMYRRALDEGLYPSMRKLADGVGVDLALVSKSVALARLPAAVIDAFPNPTQIQFRWGPALAEALQKDPDGVLRRAKKLKGEPPALAAQVFEALLREEGVLNGSTPKPTQLRAEGKQVASIAQDAKGRVTVRIEAGVLNEKQREQLERQLKALLKAE
jgi:ParB family chromosome partitioning protein